jgi:hypothetical protein
MTKHKYEQGSNKENSMIKTLITLIRCRAAFTNQGITDRNALTILDQQMRDRAQTLHQAKHSLAITTLQHKQEIARLRYYVNQAETRLTALDKGRRFAKVIQGASTLKQCSLVLIQSKF